MVYVKHTGIRAAQGAFGGYILLTNKQIEQCVEPPQGDDAN